jgi:hypothetical protein
MKTESTEQHTLSKEKRLDQLVYKKKSCFITFFFAE